MHDVTLYRIDAAKNMWRFYRLDIQPDLFGLWLLVKEWGRIGQAGQSHIASFPSIDDAQQAFERQRVIKERRGYLSV
jgi:predicted DNA-binding WGR domain protein